MRASLCKSAFHDYTRADVRLSLVHAFGLRRWRRRYCVFLSRALSPPPPPDLYDRPGPRDSDVGSRVLAVVFITVRAAVTCVPSAGRDVAERICHCDPVLLPPTTERFVRFFLGRPRARFLLETFFRDRRPPTPRNPYFISLRRLWIRRSSVLGAKKSTAQQFILIT